MKDISSPLKKKNVKMKKRIKLFDPIVDDKELLAIGKILKSGLWADGSGLNKVKQFEEEFGKISGSRFNVGVNSGTAALNIALSMEDIEKKQVILPSLSFVSTANSVLENNAKPIFGDISLETLCLDPSEIEDKISDSTKIVLPVHFGGTPADLKKIQKICKKKNLTLIEDAAHATGSSHEKVKIGSHGKFVCFSFHPVKNLAMPTGGLISINAKDSSNIMKKIKSKRWCGITDRVKTDYDVKEKGWNYYMNEFSAAIGIEQIKKLKKLNKIRVSNAKRYADELTFEEKMPFNHESVYHFYWILVKNRKKLRDILFDNGIETGTHYKPIHKMSLYNKKIHLPNTEYVGDSIITLPTHPNLKQSELDKIIKIINKFNN